MTQVCSLYWYTDGLTLQKIITTFTRTDFIAAQIIAPKSMTPFTKLSMDHLI